MTEHKFQLDRIRKGHETYPAIITEDELEDLITALKRFCRTKTKSKHVASKTHNTRWHYRHYYRILFYTGMRPDELTTIKVRDVNLASRIVRVGSEVPVKNKKERSVFLLDEILPTFEELIKGKRREDYLIPNRTMKRVSQTFRILADEIFPDRPDLVFYNLKHSCGCWMLEQGYSLESVTAQFGHADSRTTRIYAYMTNLALKNEFTRLKKNK